MLTRNALANRRRTAFRTGRGSSYESLILFRNQLWSLGAGFGSSTRSPGRRRHRAGDRRGGRPGGLAVADQLLAALLSMTWAILNLLPLPMVDGGRLLFIFIEFIRRGKRIAPRRKRWYTWWGSWRCSSLFAVITYFDIARIVNGGSLLR